MKYKFFSICTQTLKIYDMHFMVDPVFPFISRDSADTRNKVI